MNFETIVIINLTYYKKEQIDYINEQFTDVKKQLTASENQNKELKTAIADLLKRIAVLEDYMSDEDNEKPEASTKKVEQNLPKEDSSSGSRRRVRASNV
jgi:septal ring factor EnvC (AmiA/AmiB activator)